MVAAVERIVGEPRPVDILDGRGQRLTEERVMREEERPVDVEEDEELATAVVGYSSLTQFGGASAGELRAMPESTFFECGSPDVD